jgi:PmbA protein
MREMNEKLQESHFKNLISDILVQTKKRGADAEVSIAYTRGLSASIRMGIVDTVEFNKDKTLDLTVYQGKRKGSVSTTDFSTAALSSAIEAAIRIAKYTEEDTCSGLAEPAMLATVFPDLDLYHPKDITAEEAIQKAMECEAVARATDRRITQSKGTTFATHMGIRAYGNTHGFIGSYSGSRYALSCMLVGESKGLKQRDYDFSTARDYEDLESGLTIGQRAAERTVKRLDARRIKSAEVPVIFSKEIAGSLWQELIAAISGGNLYRRASFLVDHLGKNIFPAFVHLEEMPHLPKGLGSAPFDQEGVATKRHDIVREGRLESYVLGSYSARKLGLQSTGNAGGVHNLLVSSGNLELNDLIKKMNRGLVITELMGQGVNLVTGDYSRGATGFWVEQGSIQYPVEEITVAGNLKDMFLNIRDIGCDIEKRSNILTGSILLESMTVGGH